MATPNALFAIFDVSNSADVETRLERIAPWLHLKLQDGQWLLVAPNGTTTKEVCERIGINAGDSNGVVVRFDTYYGRNPASTWEWIAAKQGVELGTATPA